MPTRFLPFKAGSRAVRIPPCPIPVICALSRGDPFGHGGKVITAGMRGEGFRYASCILKKKMIIEETARLWKKDFPKS
jgi:hypothetical protein